MRSVLILPPRLDIIYKNIPLCASLIDVCSGHGLLAIKTILAGKARTAIAGDNKEGPLASVRRNLDRYCAGDRIAAVLSDGLDDLPVGNDDVVVIAGVGGETVKSILEKGAEAAKTSKMLILQPTTHESRVRNWLLTGGFEIMDEMLTEDAKRIYLTILASYTGMPIPISEAEAEVGMATSLRRSELAERYYMKKKRHFERMAKGLERLPENDNLIYLAICAELQEIKAARGEST